jgi:hypothetical protein
MLHRGDNSLAFDRARKNRNNAAYRRRWAEGKVVLNVSAYLHRAEAWRDRGSALPILSPPAAFDHVV